MLLAVFMFGLTGLPPTAGFWGKFNLFVVAWSSGSLAMKLLAVGLAVNAAIAAWYYLRLVKYAYLNPPTNEVSAVPGSQAPALYGGDELVRGGRARPILFSQRAVVATERARLRRRANSAGSRRAGPALRRQSA